MKLSLLSLFVAMAVLAMALAAPAGQKFTGVITDSMCATGDHSGMRMETGRGMHHRLRQRPWRFLRSL